HDPDREHGPRGRPRVRQAGGQAGGAGGGSDGRTHGAVRGGVGGRSGGTDSSWTPPPVWTSGKSPPLRRPAAEFRPAAALNGRPGAGTLKGAKTRTARPPCPPGRPRPAPPAAGRGDRSRPRPRAVQHSDEPAAMLRRLKTVLRDWTLALRGGAAVLRTWADEWVSLFAIPLRGLSIRRLPALFAQGVTETLALVRLVRPREFGPGLAAGGRETASLVRGAGAAFVSTFVGLFWV